MTTTDSGSIDLTCFTGSWVLDPDRTVIKFQTKILWVIPVSGNFTAVGGWGRVAEDGSVSGSIVIDANSVNTRIARRDNHLRSKDFFDVEKYPTITFALEQGAATPSGQVELSGALHLHGQTRPVGIVADVQATEDNVRLRSQFSIARSDWGISLSRGPGKARALRNQIHVIAEFRRS